MNKDELLEWDPFNGDSDFELEDIIAELSPNPPPMCDVCHRRNPMSGIEICYPCYKALLAKQDGRCIRCGRPAAETGTMSVEFASNTDMPEVKGLMCESCVNSLTQKEICK